MAIAAGAMLAAGVVQARDIKPGVERWAVKTAAPVTATARSADLASLLALANAPDVVKNDSRFDTARITAPIDGLREGELIQTTGWVHLVAFESDGDYHVQISGDASDGNNCLIVEVPKDDPQYTTDASVRAAAASVRAWFREKLLKGKEPSAGGSVMAHPPYVKVQGALFYDDAHVGDLPRGKKGMKAATLWELHSVVAIQFAPAP